MSSTQRQLRANAAGFTIPEIVVVIGCFLVFAVIAAIVLRPISYEAIETDAERRSQAARLVVALGKYHSDHKKWPDGLNTEVKKLGNDEGYVNICTALVPAYLDDIPEDPVGGAKLTGDGQEITTEPCTSDIIYDSGFTAVVSKDGNHVTVQAPEILTYKAITITR